MEHQAAGAQLRDVGFDELKNIPTYTAKGHFSAPECYQWHRQLLQDAIYDYVDYVVEDAWPQYRRGEIPTDGPARVSAVQRHLFAFQPTRMSEQVVHAEALRQFAGFTEATRNRLEFVNTGLPSMLWLIVMIGAAMTLALLWFINNDLLWVRLTASSVLAIYVGLMMFFIAAMDHPLRGAYSISPDALIELRTMMQASRLNGVAGAL